MPPLLGPDLRTPLVDSEDNVLSKDVLVRDPIYGEGITRGTIPLDRGLGFNVLIDWRQAALPGQPPKPRSRGAENLTLVGNTTRTTRTHTGAAFEAGRVHDEAGRNDEDAARLREQQGEDTGSPARPDSPDRGRREAVAGPQRNPREQHQEEAEPRHKPWLGKTENFDGASKLIISHYTHRITEERKLDGANIIMVPKIFFRTKYEPASKEKTMTGEKALNQTRMGEYLLTSEHTPDDVKEAVARKMRSSKAKEIVAAFDAKRKAGVRAVQLWFQFTLLPVQLWFQVAPHPRKHPRPSPLPPNAPLTPQPACPR